MDSSSHRRRILGTVLVALALVTGASSPARAQTVSLRDHAVTTATGPSGVRTSAPTGAPTAAAARATAVVRAAATYPKYGQRNAAVWALQKKLVQGNMMRAQYRTGTFGSRTRTAVKKLQKAYGLKRTGRVDAKTTAALGRAVKAMTLPRTWYHRETIGTSTGGRPIVAYRAGQPGKPVVVVTATMHGEEDFGQYVAGGLLEGRKISDVDLWVVPVLNPDGLLKDSRWVGRHIDLNRTFPHLFIVRANSGPKAMSVRETGVIMRFLDRVDPRYVVSWHQPLYGVDSYAVKNRALMKRLSKGLELPVRRLDCHGSCHGTMTGWFNAHHRGAAITVEYSSRARSTRTMKVRDANALLTAVGGRRG